MIAAWRAATLGASVVLFERNRKPGIKLLISGGGKCNITHAGAINDLLAGFLPREARFLKPALHRFTNSDVVGMLEQDGIATIVRPDNRIFPLSGRAEDVVGALESRLQRSGVRVELNARVTSLRASGGEMKAITAGDSEHLSAHVVLATGGASYPKTGTTGDGYAWAAALGHRLLPLRAALAPIGVRPALPPDWRGVAIRGGMLAVYAGGVKRGEFRGDVLFSHEGVTGPAALEMSRAAALAMEGADTELRMDFFPA